jgi:hypothetical protein
VAVAAALLAGCRRSETPGAAAPGPPTPVAVDQRPPFGFIDTPKENETVAPGSAVSGWALDDSGVANVMVSLDNGPASPAAFGESFPGVKEAYPTYPNSDKAGFRLALPPANTGPHLLVVTIHAKDGGRSDLKRHIQIR